MSRTLVRLLFACGTLGVVGATPRSLPAADKPPSEHITLPAVRTLDQPSQQVWCRAYVRVPDAWAAERGLFAESVTLTLEHIVDVCQVRVNGVVIGTCGSMPPSFRPARDEVHRIKIPPGLLERGRYNTILLQFYGQDGRAGLAGRAPVLAGYHDECVLAGTWEFYREEPADNFNLPIERPSLAAYDQFRPARSPLRPPQHLSPGRHLPPAESLAAMHTADDLAVELVLSEPYIAQPLALDFDDRGRLWVVEYRQYPYPAGLNMVSRDKYYRAAYDRIPEPPPRHTPGADRISIHSDSDGDGTFDTHRTFADGLNMVSSVEPTPDGVWVLNPPYLLFYADRNQDDVPDGDPEVLLEGFGLEDTHSVANSLTLGPDGWLYGAQGSTTSSRVTVRGSDAVAVYREGAMIWRYHPTTRRYEIFAEGGGNAFGLEIDAQGRLYSGHNGGNTRGFYYVQGGYFEKGTGNKYGPLSNPHAYGHLPAMPHPPTPRFSHDFIKYESVGLPEAYAGKLFSIDPLHQHLVLSSIEPVGSSFRTEDLALPLTSDDLAFRPVDITVGPDGALYIADFCEEFIAHGQHFQGQIDKTTGRVYRLRAAEPQLRAEKQATALAQVPRNTLLELLGNPNRWLRRRALHRLCHEASASDRERLTTLAFEEPGQIALEALWAVYRLGALDDELAERLFEHPNPHVRRWTVRLVGDDRRDAERLLRRLVEMARIEQDAEVCCQLAATARRLPTQACLAIVAALAVRDEWADDPYIPMFLWWALESTMDDHHAVLRLFSEEGARGAGEAERAARPADDARALPEPSKFWSARLVREVLLERMMRRYGSGGRRDLEACAELLERAPDKETRELLLAGFERAFSGRTLGQLPPRLVQALAAAGGASIALQARQGNPDAVAQVLHLARSTDIDQAKRLEAVRLLGEIGPPEAMPVLLELVESDVNADLAEAALAALARFDRPEIATRVLERLAQLPEPTHRRALALLASRPDWSRRLVEAVRSGRMPAERVPQDIVARLALHREPAVTAEIAKVWPEATSPSTEAIRATLERVLSALSQGSGDPYRGSALFEASCQRCHVLFRQGGNIGPDLTSYDRTDLSRMALQVVNPSLEIREGFETWVVWTEDGRVATGFLVDQDAHVLVLRDAEGSTIPIPLEAIDQRERSPRSVMPEGLLDGLSDDQVRDLFAYLRASQPLNE